MDSDETVDADSDRGSFHSDRASASSHYSHNRPAEGADSFKSTGALLDTRWVVQTVL